MDFNVIPLAPHRTTCLRPQPNHEQDLSSILACAYKRNRRQLVFPIKIGRGSTFCAYPALTATRQIRRPSVSR